MSDLPETLPPIEVRMAEIVFPNHTNHMGTLFGGQAMAWGLPAAPVEVWSLLALLLVLTAWMKNPLQLVASFRADWRWLAASVLLMLWSLYALAHVSDFLYFQF